MTYFIAYLLVGLFIFIWDAVDSYEDIKHESVYLVLLAGLACVLTWPIVFVNIILDGLEK